MPICLKYIHPGIKYVQIHTENSSCNNSIQCVRIIQTKKSTLIVVSAKKLKILFIFAAIIIDLIGVFYLYCNEKFLAMVKKYLFSYILLFLNNCKLKENNLKSE